MFSTILMNENKELRVTTKPTIFHQETNADSLLILLPLYYGELNLRDCGVTLHYLQHVNGIPIDVQSLGATKLLTFSEELYKDKYLQSEVPITLNETGEVGQLEIFLQIVNAENEVVLKTGSAFIDIKPHRSVVDYIPPTQMDVFSDYLIKMQQEVDKARVSATQSYDSSLASEESAETSKTEADRSEYFSDISEANAYKALTSANQAIEASTQAVSSKDIILENLSKFSNYRRKDEAIVEADLGLLLQNKINSSEVDDMSSSLNKTYSSNKINGLLGSKADTAALNNKVDKILGKGLSTNDYTTEEKSKLLHIEAGANYYEHPDNEFTRHVSDAQMNSWDNKPTKEEMNSAIGGMTGLAPETLNTIEKVATAIDNDPNFFNTINAQLENKVDKVIGKQLSTEDYTTTDKNKVAGIEAYVNGKIAELVSTAPESLDTLQELASALGNDADFATTVLNHLGNKVDKEVDKGLTTNDYTNEDKAKVDNIENSLLGKSDVNHTHTELHNHSNKDVIDLLSSDLDGNLLYNGNPIASTPTGETSANIDDIISSSTTTYSSSKIEAELAEKAHIDHSHSELHTHDNKEVLDTVTSIGDGTKFLSDDGTYKTVATSGETGTANVIQKTFLNVKAGDKLNVPVSSNKVLIQAYQYIEGEQDVVEILKTFDNGEAENFNYNSENVMFDGAMKIRDTYAVPMALNDEGFYESGVINTNEFIELVGIEVV